MVFQRKETLKMSDFLMWCFAVWPLFWNIWGTFKITTLIGPSISIYILWAITLMYALLHRRLRISYLFIWFAFLGVVAAESFRQPSLVIVDLSVILCGVLFCIFAMNRNLNYQMLIKCLFFCGLIISISVIIDNTLGIFSNALINLYTEEAKFVKLRLNVTGGLLPHTGSAGCYIFSGLAAYIIQTRLKGKSGQRLGNWMMIIIFGISALLIQKRGFLVDAIVSIVLIKFIELSPDDLMAININIQNTIKKILLVLFVAVVVVFLYYRVELIHEAFDSLINRFTTEDGTMSGRTDLYSLAFSLYNGHTLTGIGWGRFRANTLGIFGVADATYSAHNVYIQLLCETGILGLGAFLLSAVSTLFYGISKYRRIIVLDYYDKEKSILQLGLFMQLFFLTYCMTGNPLYDYNFLITYFIGIIFALVPV